MREVSYRVTYSASNGDDALTDTVNGHDVTSAMTAADARRRLLWPDWLRTQYFISAVVPAGNE
jgi:hypothetical protein